MNSVKIERPSDWEKARLFVLSDLHIGDANCNEYEVGRVVEEIAKDPNAVVILNGDLMNTATRASVSDVYGETMRPSEQLVYCNRLLTPIADKIIGATCGNHESRIYKADGVDMMRLLCRELGCESVYSPEGILIFLRFGLSKKRGGRPTDSKRTYSIYATHGSGGGRKEGGKMNRLADLAGIVDADIYIHSHTHLPAYFAEDFFRTDVQNAKVVQVMKGFLNTAAALNYGGYGQMQSYKPVSIRFPFIELSGNIRDFRVCI